MHRFATPFLILAFLSTAGIARAGWDNQGMHTDILLGLDFPAADQGWAVGALDGVGPVIKHSEDGGDTWTYQDSDLRNFYWMDVDMADLKNGWTAGLVALIGRWSVAGTTDGGRTWTGQLTKYNMSAFLDVYALDRNTAWASGFWLFLLQEHEGIVRTVNGGDKWTAHDWKKPESARFIDFEDADHGWMTGGHWPENAGSARIWRPTEHHPMQVVMPEEYARRRTALATDYGCLIARTSNGGKDWETVYQSNLFYPNHVDFVNRNEGWVVVESDFTRRILHTTDGGDTWEHQTIPIEDELVSLTTINMFNRREGWAIGFGSTLFGNPETRFLHTTDGGKTWEVDPFTSNVGPLHASFVDEGTGWTVGSNNFNVSRVIRYDEPSRKPVLTLEVLNAPEQAGGSDRIRFDAAVQNKTNQGVPVDAWVQITGPTIPGYEVNIVLRTGIVVPPGHSGLHPVTVQLPGLPSGVYGVELLLGPAESENPYEIRAYDDFNLVVP